MPIAYQLTYHQARKCWRKKYRGKVFYLGRAGTPKTDRKAYELALQEWEAVKRHFDNEGPPPYGPGKEFDPAEYKQRLGEFLLNSSHNNHNDGTPSVASDVASPAVFMATDYSKLPYSPSPTASKPKRTVELAELIAEYLRQRKIQAETTTKLSVKQYGQDKAKLEDFSGFASKHGKRLMSAIDSPFLTFYREVQERLLTEDKSIRISSETARKRLQTVQKFWKWAYRNEYIHNLPRVLDSHYASIAVARPEPKFWTVQELRTLFKAASPRTKLYIALAANAGYTQAEIATLTWDMIDGNIIRRKRPKSGQRQTHVLWPVTLKLLQDASPSRTGLCLLGQKGNNLLVQAIRADGGVTHTDAIRLAFVRTLKRTKMNGTGRTFKNIRKTSANLISQQFEDNRLTDLFLGHSSKAMRDHYIDNDKPLKQYFAAVEWLGTQYRFEELLKPDVAEVKGRFKAIRKAREEEERGEKK